MSSRCNSIWQTLCAAAFVLMGNHQAGAASGSGTVHICIDTGSPAASINRNIAEAVAKEAGWSPVFLTSRWNGPDDDDGLNGRAFGVMAHKGCDFIMGYPMSAANVNAPDGLQHTGAYIHTGLVLAGRGDIPSWPALQAGSVIGVTYDTVANLLLAERGGMDLRIFNTEAETVAAARAGKVPVALVWDLAAQGADGDTGGLTVRKIGLPQADWVLVALYPDRDAALGKSFDAALSRLRASGRLDALGHAAKPVAGPRLFTAAQADDGAKLFADNCAVCHGVALQGNVGPALRGTAFAGPTDGYTVGAMFTFFSTQMPAGAPGSLKKEEYAALMAFLLRENGYPADSTALTYDAAMASTVPLVSRISSTGPNVATATTADKQK